MQFLRSGRPTYLGLDQEAQVVSTNRLRRTSVVEWASRFIDALIVTIPKASHEQLLFVMEKAITHRLFSTIEHKDRRKLLTLITKSRLKSLSEIDIEQVVTSAGKEMKLAWKEAHTEVADTPLSEKNLADMLSEQLERHLTANVFADLVDMAQEDEPVETQDMKDLVNQYFVDINFRHDFREIVLGKGYKAEDTLGRQKNVRKVPFVLDHFNELMRGGAGVGELWLVIGGQNSGKSHTLVATAAAAALAGETVVIFTLEMSAASYEERILSNLTGVPAILLSNWLKENPKKAERIINKLASNIYIKEYPTGSAGVAHFKNYFAKLRMTGVTPTVCVVDYADLMKASGWSRDKEYLANAATYRELRRFCQEEDVVCWTATQLNRGGVSKGEEADETDVAGAFEKLPIVDGAFVLRATKQERGMGRGRFLLAKNRTNTKLHKGKVAELLVEMQSDTMNIEGLSWV